jgi:hypothetical protein
LGPLAAAVAFAGCDGGMARHALVPGPFQLSAAPLVIPFATPARATGPAREVCFHVRGAADLARAVPLRAPGRDRASVRAVLIRTDGGREPIGEGRPPHASVGPRSVCLEDRGLASVVPDTRPVRVRYDSATGMTAQSAAEGPPPPPRTASYRAVELSSAVPVSVFQVSFSSGARRPVLF